MRELNDQWRAGISSDPQYVKLSAVIACYRDAPAVPIMHERLVGVFDELGC